MPLTPEAQRIFAKHPKFAKVFARADVAKRFAQNETSQDHVDFGEPPTSHQDKLGTHIAAKLLAGGYAVKHRIAFGGSNYVVASHPNGEETKIRVADHHNTSTNPDITSRFRDADFKLTLTPDGKIAGWKNFKDSWPVVTSAEWENAFGGHIDPNDLYDHHRKAYQAALKRERRPTGVSVIDPMISPESTTPNEHPTKMAKLSQAGNSRFSQRLQDFLKRAKGVSVRTYGEDEPTQFAAEPPEQFARASQTQLPLPSGANLPAGNDIGIDNLVHHLNQHAGSEKQITFASHTDTKAPKRKRTGEVNPYSSITKYSTQTGTLNGNYEQAAREKSEREGTAYVPGSTWHSAGTDHRGKLTPFATHPDGDMYLRVMHRKYVGEPEYYGHKEDGTSEKLDPSNPEHKRIIDTFVPKEHDLNPLMRVYSLPSLKHVIFNQKSHRVRHHGEPVTDAPTLPPVAQTPPAAQEPVSPPMPVRPQAPTPTETVPATAGMAAKADEPPEAIPARTQTSRSPVDEQVKGSRLGYHLGQIARKYKDSNPEIAKLAKDGMQGLSSSYSKLGNALKQVGDKDFSNAYRWEHVGKGLNLDRTVRNFVKKWNVQVNPNVKKQADGKDVIGGNHFMRLAQVIASGKAGQSGGAWNKFWTGLREAAKKTGVFGTNSKNDQTVLEAIRRSLNRNANRHEDLASGSSRTADRKALPTFTGKPSGTKNAERFRKREKAKRFGVLDDYEPSKYPSLLDLQKQRQTDLRHNPDLDAFFGANPPAPKAAQPVAPVAKPATPKITQSPQPNNRLQQQLDVAKARANPPQSPSHPKSDGTLLTSSVPPPKPGQDHPSHVINALNKLGDTAYIPPTKPLTPLDKFQQLIQQRQKGRPIPAAKPGVAPLVEMQQIADKLKQRTPTPTKPFGPLPTGVPTLRDLENEPKKAKLPNVGIADQKSKWATQHHKQSHSIHQWTPDHPGYIDLTHPDTLKSGTSEPNAKASDMYPALAQAKRDGYHIAVVSHRDRRTQNSYVPVAAYVSKNPEEARELAERHKELVGLRRDADRVAKTKDIDPKADPVKAWKEGGTAKADGSGKTLIDRAKEVANEMRDLLGHKQDIRFVNGTTRTKDKGLHVHGARLMLRHRAAPKRFSIQPPNPSVANSLAQTNSQQQHRLREVAARILHKYNLTPHRLADAISDTSANSKPGVAQAILKPVSPSHTKRAAAQYGLMSGQDSLLVFHGHQQGPDSLYGIDMPGSGNDIRKSLDAAGLSHRTLLPNKNGFRVLIHDAGRQLRPKVEQFANSIGATVNESTGFGEKIGGQGKTPVAAAPQTGPAQMAKKEKPKRFGALSATKPQGDNFNPMCDTNSAEFDPALAESAHGDHPVFHPEAHWQDKSTRNHVNPVWKVQDANQKMWFVKKAEHNPEEAHTDPAARSVLRHLGFDEVPETQKLIAQHRGEPIKMVVGPWEHLRSTLSGLDSSKPESKRWMQQQDPKRIVNLLTAEHVIHAMDRNPGNYGVTNDGKIVPIDYGESWSVLPWRNESDHSWVRDEREPSPRSNDLADFAKETGIINGGTPLNKDFLQKLLSERPFIEHKFESEVAPHLPPEDTENARRVLAEKFAHLGDLVNQPSPKLSDLKAYKGMHQA